MHLCVHSPEMKYTKQSAIGCIFQCSFTGNEMYKTKLPLFASKEKHVGKPIYSYTRRMLLLLLEFSSERRSKNNTNFWESFDAKVAEKLFKMLGKNPSDTQTDLLMFLSIWTAFEKLLATLNTGHNLTKSSYILL